jgi:phosphoadenosine phosphosulfate reductase
MSIDPDLLRTADPEAILRWGVETFPERLVLSASFGAGGIVLAHMLGAIDRSVPVLFLDTGMHFAETIAFRDLVAERLGLTMIEARPIEDPGPLYESDPDRCCAIRKVEPMRRALAGFDAWASAVRRDQGGMRAKIETIEHHEADGRALVKLHPLAAWSRDDVERYVRAHDLPRHPLHERGYASIGCWPCTRPVHAGESERAGRWAGTAKTECGIHTFTARR